MKKYPTILIKLIFILVALNPFQTNAKEAVSGYDFWLGFFNNNVSNEPNDLVLFITADETTKGTVSLPLLNWSEDFTASPGTPAMVKVPVNLANNTVSGQIGNRGIRVNAVGKVSVFAINSSQYTTDGTIILPTQFLHNEYFMVSYQGYYQGNGNLPNELLIIGTENNSIIEITPSVETENGHPAKIPFQIRLNEGQSYLLRPKGPDLTGTEIKGLDCKNFAVFAGSKGSHIPFDCSAVDHLFHQMLPNKHLGRRYLLGNLNGDFSFRIVATQNNTTVNISGMPSVTLNRGEFHTVHNRKLSLSIDANRPVLVAQFLQGTMCSNGGDPAMLVVPPIENLYTKASYVVPQVFNMEKHFVQIITKSQHVNRLRLNGNPIGNGFVQVNGASGYSFRTIEVQPGAVNIASDSGFVAIAFGIGWANSYLFTVGFKEEITLDVKIDKQLCIGAQANFYCSLDGPVYSWSWDFGDNNNKEGKNVMHHYHKEGTYMVTLTIDLDGECPIIYRDKVKVYPFPVLNLPKKVEVCGDHEINLRALEPNLHYNWSTGENTREIKAGNTGLYILEATNGVCYTTDTVSVLRTPYPHVVEISPDTTIFINNSAYLYASGGNAFKWSPSTSLSCTDCPNPIASPKHTTTYIVQVYDGTGCMALDSVIVKVDADLKVFVPNIFSPNNDGQNDILYVRGKGIKNLKFFVYNRWGEKVFESNHEDNGWDGTHRGAPLQPAVFVYFLDAILQSGERVIKKGDVTLVR
jgi:gliding motility-associated-like protein